jgi:serine protease Do
VSDVDANSNSAEAGLQRGDIIVEINQKPVANAKDAIRLCEAAAKDEHILVKIWRQMGDFAGTRYLSVDNTRLSK